MNGFLFIFHYTTVYKKTQTWESVRIATPDKCAKIKSLYHFDATFSAIYEQLAILARQNGFAHQAKG
jgi:hypothetical protein